MKPSFLLQSRYIFVWPCSKLWSFYIIILVSENLNFHEKILTDFFIGNGLTSLCSAPQGFDVWRNWYFNLNLHHSRAVILKLKMLDRSSFANCLAWDTLSTLLKPAPICSSHCLSPSIAKPGSELRNGESSTVSFSDIPSSKQADLFLERRINGKSHW